jgi:hypothetical protein
LQPDAIGYGVYDPVFGETYDGHDQMTQGSAPVPAEAPELPKPVLVVNDLTVRLMMPE